MTFRRLLIVAWRERRRRWRQSAALVGVYAAAVVVATALVVLLITSRRATDTILRNTGTHFMAFAPASPKACLAPMETRPGEGLVCGSIPALPLPTNWISQISSVPGVLDASPYLMYRFRDDAHHGTITVGGFDVANKQAVGTTTCAEGDIVSGRFLRLEDRGGCLLEEGFAHASDISVGSRLAIAGQEFAVLGIVNPGIRPAKADVYMPYAEAAELARRRGASKASEPGASAILVEVRSAQRQEEAIAMIKALFPCLVVSSYACYKPAAAVMGIQAHAVGTAVAGVYLAVCLFALLTQTAAVTERRRDLAVLSALGWSAGEIAGMVIMEAMLCTAVGAVVGTILAPAVLSGVAHAFSWGSVPWTALRSVPVAAAIAAALALASGLLACAGPVIGVLRVRPAEVFRKT
jgi:putative ABC transport system permease protein